MTIKELRELHPESTDVEIYVHDDDNHRRQHPEFVEYVESDDKLLNHDFQDIEWEMYDAEKYLSEWDVSGILTDCIDDNANILMIFLGNDEYHKFIEEIN